MVRPWYWPKEGMPERTEPFTWIIKGKMAASWWPDPSVIENYRREGIKVIINCSEFDNRKDIPKEFMYFHLNIPDYGTPTDVQLQRFFEITSESSNNNVPIVVHCVAGCGRSGLMIVAWAAYNGYIPKGIDPVKWIRKLRSCCLETKEQMELARKIAKKYQKTIM
ncbi:MAG: dual specificity protein phosphatase family protein [Candidatus Lokiarchaeota archaeon]|nr:dual specificity protein phosphatase family protein [Candidatus Lokiarchaeota archaeon]